ncbi:MAG TPA: hypothetical protein VGJ60_03215 [Chloroflexota bacterium]
MIESDVTDGAVRIYSDNQAMTRWLQGEIERLLYPPFADVHLPVTRARFGRDGDTGTAWTETVRSEGDDIPLTWSGFAEPFVLTVNAGKVPSAPWRLQLLDPGRQRAGGAQWPCRGGATVPQQRGESEGSTACLALSETWVLPPTP